MFSGQRFAILAMFLAGQVWAFSKFNQNIWIGIRHNFRNITKDQQQMYTWWHPQRCNETLFNIKKNLHIKILFPATYKLFQLKKNRKCTLVLKLSLINIFKKVYFLFSAYYYVINPSHSVITDEASDRSADLFATPRCLQYIQRNWMYAEQKSEIQRNRGWLICLLHPINRYRLWAIWIEMTKVVL